MGFLSSMFSSSPPNEAVSSDQTDAFKTMLTLTSSANPDDDTVKQLAGAAVGQVVAMIGEDARTYMQGMEQIYTAASGKALVLIANPATKQEGVDLLTNIATSQGQTLAFATGAATIAAAFSKL